MPAMIRDYARVVKPHAHNPSPDQGTYTKVP
jgi:hypothetical protein